MTETVLHRGAIIRILELPGKPCTWSHGETDEHGAAWSSDEARNQINAHLDRVASKQS